MAVHSLPTREDNPPSQHIWRPARDVALSIPLCTFVPEKSTSPLAPIHSCLHTLNGVGSNHLIGSKNLYFGKFGRFGKKSLCWSETQVWWLLRCKYHPSSHSPGGCRSKSTTTTALIPLKCGNQIHNQICSNFFWIVRLDTHSSLIPLDTTSAVTENRLVAFSMAYSTEGTTRNSHPLISAADNPCRSINCSISNPISSVVRIIVEIRQRKRTSLHSWLQCRIGIPYINHQNHRLSSTSSTSPTSIGWSIRSAPSERMPVIIPSLSRTQIFFPIYSARSLHTSVETHMRKRQRLRSNGATRFSSSNPFQRRGCLQGLFMGDIDPNSKDHRGGRIDKFRQTTTDFFAFCIHNIVGPLYKQIQSPRNLCHPYQTTNWNLLNGYIGTHDTRYNHTMLGITQPGPPQSSSSGRLPLHTNIPFVTPFWSMVCLAQMVDSQVLVKNAGWRHNADAICSPNHLCSTTPKNPPLMKDASFFRKQIDNLPRRETILYGWWIILVCDTSLEKIKYDGLRYTHFSSPQFEIG